MRRAHDQNGEGARSTVAPEPAAIVLSFSRHADRRFGIAREFRQFLVCHGEQALVIFGRIHLMRL